MAHSLVTQNILLGQQVWFGKVHLMENRVVLTLKCITKGKSSLVDLEKRYLNFGIIKL